MKHILSFFIKNLVLRRRESLNLFNRTKVSRDLFNYLNQMFWLIYFKFYITMVDSPNNVKLLTTLTVLVSSMSLDGTFLGTLNLSSYKNVTTDFICV
jgi:hypothetical protein